MRIRDWSKLAATATTAFHVQYALLPAPTTTSTGNRIRPTQESSSTSSGSGSAHTASPPRLAVVVPTWRGDVDRALEAAARWPTACSAVTLSQVDLVLYKAEGDQGSSASSLSSLEKTGGRCFSKTKIVHANLADEVRGRGRVGGCGEGRGMTKGETQQRRRVQTLHKEVNITRHGERARVRLKRERVVLPSALEKTGDRCLPRQTLLTRIL